MEEKKKIKIYFISYINYIYNKDKIYTLKKYINYLMSLKYIKNTSILYCKKEIKYNIYII